LNKNLAPDPVEAFVKSGYQQIIEGNRK